ncbi:MAG: NUDIX hydrolase [Rhodospirillaceae bacterium]|nr:MAG: NUDIX hydrolase [Rhodospirillaceae bacterium]
MEQRNLFSPGTTDIAPRADLLACLAAATRRPEACVMGRGGGIPSAVLVPLVDHVPGFTILLTRRAGHLASHRGQVCFPGGRVEAHDDGPVATALRETFEEVGLPSAAVTVIGCLDDYATLTGFMITPVVGVIAPPLLLRIAPEEVETAFEMPLSFLLDPAHHHRLTPVHSRIVRTTYAIPWQGHYVWGATAAMLMNLYRIIGRMRTER